MSSPEEEAVRRAYAAINRRDIEGFVSEFADNAVWHGSGMDIQGNEAIGELVGNLIEASAGTLHIEVHDVLSSDEHVVVLQVTTAERNGRRLDDKVAYIFHMENGKIAEAWFSGDPRIQDEFWSA